MTRHVLATRPAHAAAADGAGDGAGVWGGRATWQITLRWLVPPAIVAGVAAGRLLGYGFEAVPVLSAAAFVQTYNLVFWAVLVSSRSEEGAAIRASSTRQVVAQIALDYAAMFVLVFYTGGLGSPLLAFFLFHVIFAAILLEARIAWGFAVVAVAAALLLAAGDLGALPVARPLSFRGTVLAPTGDAGRVPMTVVFFGLSVLVVAATTTAVVARLRAENARALAAIQAAADERSHIMLQVAHNLRSPLAAAIGLLDVLAGDYAGPVTDTQRDYLDRAHRRLTGLNDTAGALLALARQRATGDEVVLDLVDLAAVVGEATASLAPLAEEKAITFAAIVPDDLPAVRGQADALRQVVENLVSNAIKYTPSGGDVEVELAPGADRRVRLVVRDTGIGIPAAEQGRLFEDFFRASNARQHDKDGTGLGLAYSRDVVEAAGGTIGLESIEGAGTTVTVELPAIKAAG